MADKRTTTSAHSHSLPTNSSARFPEPSPAALEKAIRTVILRHLPSLCEEIAIELHLRPKPRTAMADMATHPACDIPTADDLFGIAVNGGREALAEKLQLPRDLLATLIGSLGLDPSRRIRRWKDDARIRNYLIDELMIRAGRNRSFLDDENGSERGV